MQSRSTPMGNRSDRVGMETTDTLQCRPKGSTQATGILCLVIVVGLCVIPAHALLQHPGRDMTMLLMTLEGSGVLFGGLSLYGFLFLCRARVVADKHQIRWRGILGWRSAYWTEVTDYFDRENESGVSTVVVETPAGKLTVTTVTWNHIPELKDRVLERATRARATAWGEQGCRPEIDWPRIFTYDATRNRRTIWAVGGATVLFVAMPLATTLTQYIHRSWTPGWQWGLAALCLAELVCLAYAMIPLSVVNEHRDALNRLNERIIVDGGGLTFEDGTRRVRALWSEIRGWKVGSPSEALALRNRYTVETENNSFVFTRCLQDAQILRRILTLQLGRKPGRFAAEEDLNPLDITASSEPCRSLYTYKTRTNRALLLIPTVLAVAGFVPLIRPFLFESDPPVATQSWVFIGCLKGSLWIGALYGWARYRKHCIEIDRDGITERRLFSSRRLIWEEVASYSLRKDSFMGHVLVKGERNQVRFSLMIEHLDQLKAEIAQRAVCSKNREWNEPTETL